MKTQQRFRRRMSALIAVAALVGACAGSDSEGAASSDDGSVAEDLPTVVVTTNILGDVVSELVGDQANVVTIMPVGADPHEFQASAQEVDEIQSADVLIVNGADFEENLLDVIEAAEADGVATFAASSAVESIEYTDEDDHGHEEEDEHEEDEHEEDEHEEDEHEEDAHEDEDAHDDEGDHGHEGVDPHFFTDPASMALAAAAIGDFLIDNLDGVDADALGGSIDAYVATLEGLDAEVTDILATVPDENRVLVTNHEVFAYFAASYGFEEVGAIIPSGSTADGTSAETLAELAEVIEHEGVPAIFTDNTTSSELAETLAAEVGSDIEIVELFTGSLGDDGSGGGTYVEMVRTNAERIAAALS